MFKSLKEFDTAVFEILTKIRDDEDYCALSSTYGETKFDDALEYCVESKFIAGLKVDRVASGKLVTDAVRKIRITRDGLQYIENFKP